MKKGWENATLGEVCHVYQPQTLAQKALKPGPYPVFGANGQIGWHSEFNHENEELVLGCRGSVGTVHVTPKKTWINGNAMVVRPKDSRISLELLRYAFLGGIKLGDAISGTAQPQITRASLSPLALCFPTARAQQDQLSNKLDEAFAGLAKAKENAEKNLQNARALFESHLETVFTQRGHRWAEKTLEEVCHKITDGTHHSPKKQLPERAPGTFPYITSKNIRNNYMDLSGVTYIERAFHEEAYARCQPSHGDVLLTKDGANTGNVTLNTLNEPFSLLSSVCLIKTDPNMLRPAFLCFYLQSSTGLSSIVGQMTGAAIKRIVLKDIKKAVISFPPLKEQDSIVTKQKHLLEETQSLARLYEQKLEALESFKKSILHEAFSGNL